VSGTVALVQETHAKEIEEVRLKDARRRAVEHFEFFTKRRSDEVERFENLEAAATDWERAARIRAFADAVEAEAKSCGNSRRNNAIGLPGFAPRLTGWTLYRSFRPSSRRAGARKTALLVATPKY